MTSPLEFFVPYMRFVVSQLENNCESMGFTNALSLYPAPGNSSIISLSITIRLPV